MDIVLRQGSTGVVEIIPQEDGSIIIRVNEGAQVKQNYGSKENKPFKFHNGNKSPEETIEDMKAAAREEYKKAGADKDEITKFVKFYERKIQEDGWNGEFRFSSLYEKWLSKKK